VPTNAQPKLSPKKEKRLVEEEEVAIPRPEPISPNKVIVRTVSACVMTLLYLLMLQAGHFYCILVGIISQIELFRELVNVRYVEAKLRSMPLFRTLQWSWFTLAMIYVYGGKIKKFCIQPYAFIFQHQNHFACQLLTANIAQYIDYIVFVGYCIVFMATVLTFKKHLIRFQISQVNIFFFFFFFPFLFLFVFFSTIIHQLKIHIRYSGQSLRLP
jgi:phosphatidate cytidylyltransferase